MIFLSTLLREPVVDLEGQKIGTLRDICVSRNETFPTVTGLVIHNGSKEVIIPWSQVHTLETDKQIHLSVNRTHMSSYTPESDELLLRRDILDKQIVDTQGFRVVKVNDLKLAQIKSTARLIGVDISWSGLLRRLGMLSPVETLGRVLPISLEERTVTWNYVEPIEMVEAPEKAVALAGAGVASPGTVSRVQLNVSHNKLSDLRPADIADILEQLDVEGAEAVLSRLDDETAADALNEVETDLQAELLSELAPERASQLLERLSPDDAADILADLPQQEAEHLLTLMSEAESRPIRDLLRYGQETAGGLMTNEVLRLSLYATVEEALTYLRQHSKHLEMVYYIYIVDDQQHLVGVVSLRQLVTAEPQTQLKDLMDHNVLKVHTDTDQEEVARMISKYDLLGVPVVDSDEKLVGLVTVDDVIDVLHEEQAQDISEISGTAVEELEQDERFSWLATVERSRWLAVNLVTGLGLALVLRQFFAPLMSTGSAKVASLVALPMNAQPLSLVLLASGCLLPLALMTSSSVGSQALGVRGWQLRNQRGRDFFQGIFHELRLTTLGGVASVLVVGIFSWLVFHSLTLGISLGLSVGAMLFIAAVAGLALPTLFQRLRLRGGFVSAPLIDPLIAAISLCLFLALNFGLNRLLGL